MNQLDQEPVLQGPGPAGNNVYTVMMAVAAVALVVGVGYVWYRASTLFGTSSPFEIVFG